MTQAVESAQAPENIATGSMVNVARAAPVECMHHLQETATSGLKEDTVKSVAAGCSGPERTGLLLSQISCTVRRRSQPMRGRRNQSSHAIMHVNRRTVRLVFTIAEGRSVRAFTCDAQRRSTLR